MKPTIMRGDARALPLADASVDLIVTSPPYFGLRSYQDGGEHYAGQMGSESSPREFVDALIDCTREMVRVLKPSGSIFVNLGDKYAGDSTGCRDTSTRRGPVPAHPAPEAFPTKSLMLLPERYRIAAVDELGLIARAVIVWSKPNGLPESVKDRVRRSHEDWVHLTKRPRYFTAVDEIREAHAAKTLTHRGGGQAYGNDRNPDNQWGNPNGKTRFADPLGKLPGSVWEIASQPLKVPAELGVEHFAAFPMEWPRRLITGWCPRDVCTVCGEGRRPVRGVDWDSVDHRIEHKRQLSSDDVAAWCHKFAEWCLSVGVTRQELDDVCGTNGMGRHWTNPGQLGSAVPTVEQWALIVEAFRPPADLARVVHSTVPVRVSNFKAGLGGVVGGKHRNAGPRTDGLHHTITGFTCACPDTSAPATPGVVLDPFGGTGTTALVATMLGRRGISVDLSADYGRLAAWRCSDPKERARAAGIDASTVVTEIPGQAALFDHEASA